MDASGSALGPMPVETWSNAMTSGHPRGAFAVPEWLGDPRAVPVFRRAFLLTCHPPRPRGVQSNFLDLMAAAVGPAALFAVGLSLVGRKLGGNVGEVIWLSVVKAVINPILAFLLVTYVFVMEPLWSEAAVVLSAMPVGTNPYVIAQQYNVHVKTVSPTIVVSTRCR